MCTSHQPDAGADSAPIPNHYAVTVDGALMASGPGDQHHAEAMRDAYRTINPRASVRIGYSRCDENPHGPCAAHPTPGADSAPVIPCENRAEVLDPACGKPSTTRARRKLGEQALYLCDPCADAIRRRYPRWVYTSHDA